MELAKRKCVPCDKGMSPLDAGGVRLLLGEVRGWTATADNKKIEKRFSFPDFVAAVKFINKMADVAEVEGHHPDFSVHYNKIDVALSTHDVGGLSENDFIVAAKLDQL